MKKSQIFIGNIKKCTKYEEHNTISSSTYIEDQCIGYESFGTVAIEDEIYKKNAILIKIKNGAYVDLEELNSLLDYVRVSKNITKNGFHPGGLIMTKYGYYDGCLFVDKNSLRPYYPENSKNNVSIKQLKKIKNTR